MHLLDSLLVFKEELLELCLEVAHHLIVAFSIVDVRSLCRHFVDASPLESCRVYLFHLIVLYHGVNRICFSIFLLLLVTLGHLCHESVQARVCILGLNFLFLLELFEALLGFFLLLFLLFFVDLRFGLPYGVKAPGDWLRCLLLFRRLECHVYVLAARLGIVLLLLLLKITRP